MAGVVHSDLQMLFPCGVFRRQAPTPLPPELFLNPRLKSLYTSRELVWQKSLSCESVNPIWEITGKRVKCKLRTVLLVLSIALMNLVTAARASEL